MHQATATIWRGPRFLHWNQDLADAVMAIAIMAAGFVSAFQDHAQFDAVSVSLLVLQSLPIAWRRRNPLRILVVTGLAITLYSVCGYPESGAQFGVFVAFYTVAANEPRRRATVAALLTAGGIFVSFAAEATVYSISDATGSLTSTYIFYGLAWLIGDNLRVRRAYTRELENRAARLEQDREEMASQAVTEERARIARELHDVVAHYVSVMVVQAAGARRIVDKDPDAAKGAIEAVETAGRTALAEMRRMLEVLRADDPGTGPQPGLGEVERLLETVREAGLPVQLSIKGTACCLPAGMDLAAYRIVQEALTNTVKHGGKASARVSITYADEYVEIEAIDDGRGAAAQILTSTPSGGHGLIGMKERVALFGGILEAGPVLTGGYRVHARLPLELEDAARAKSQREATLAAQGWTDGSHTRPGAERHHVPHEPAPTRRPLPPLMVRVLPPHPVEQHPHSRRERGEL